MSGRSPTTTTRRTRPYTVVVEGNIGSGKTTFLEPFAAGSCRDFVEVVEEPVGRWRDFKGHNLLRMMYEDPKRHAFMFQSFVQLTMIQHHTKPVATRKPVRILERSLLRQPTHHDLSAFRAKKNERPPQSPQPVVFFSSARYCFVENLLNEGSLSEAEYLVISEWFNFLITQPELDFKVDEIVYLRTDPEVALERIMERSRGEETLISLQYLRNLHQLHEDWLINKTKFQPLLAPVTVIEANHNLDIMSAKYRDYEQSLIARFGPEGQVQVEG